MKGKTILTSLIILVIATLSLYVSAQSQTDKEQDSAKPSVYIGPLVVGRGMGIGMPPKNPPVLLQAILQEDGTVGEFRVMPSGGSTIGNIINKKLRIEYMNGAFSEVDLKEVKRITIE
jgi:hypothetical protein